MATTREIIRYNIGQISESIRKIKQSNPDISPKSPIWARYRQLKREASIWLTMISMVKVSDGTRADVVVHAGSIGKKAMFRRARLRLGKLAGRLERTPSKWSHVDQWVAKRQSEMAGASQ